ncbi:MAG: LicD family protein [Erysipelotrichaceae bacterium]|nr:LicD family protein [Erysipelotrichaceae bacterium]
MEKENVRNLSLEETKIMQNKMLEILLYFKDFCDKYGLMFYLAGGCAIGAVRHKGFIPWDDDIDCFMPRDDYEKLKILWEQYGDKEKYTYCRTDRDYNYHHAAASLRDNNTTFINMHSKDEDICHGMALEFIPIDGCPKKLHSRVWQLINASAFVLFNNQRLPDNKGKFFRFMSKILYSIIRSKKIRDDIWIYAEKQLSKYKWEDCDYVTELIGSLKGMMYKHPKSWFDHVVYKEFEGYDMPLMAGYDQYLHLIWGDYMQLPPEEQRVAKHNTVYLNTEVSYLKYKGIYYCVNKDDKAK